MHTMQAARIDAASHGALAETQAVYLSHRYDSVLSARDLRNRHVRPGDFSSHTGG
jgi:hypothetical protein